MKSRYFGFFFLTSILLTLLAGQFSNPQSLLKSPFEVHSFFSGQQVQNHPVCPNHPDSKNYIAENIEESDDDDEVKDNFFFTNNLDNQHDLGLAQPILTLSNAQSHLPELSFSCLLRLAKLCIWRL